MLNSIGIGFFSKIGIAEREAQHFAVLSTFKHRFESINLTHDDENRRVFMCLV